MNWQSAVFPVVPTAELPSLPPQVHHPWTPQVPSEGKTPYAAAGHREVFVQLAENVISH